MLLIADNIIILGGLPIRFWWKIILVLTLVVFVSIPAVLFWITATERFPFSESLDVERDFPRTGTIRINLSDSGKLIASLYMWLEWPPQNTTGVPLHFVLEQLDDTELDSMKLEFKQYGYKYPPASLEASSNIPLDQFNITSLGEKTTVVATDLGSYGSGNITLNFVLGLRQSYRVWDHDQFDVSINLWLSIHHRALIQLTSLKVDTGATLQVRA